MLTTMPLWDAGFQPSVQVIKNLYSVPLLVENDPCYMKFVADLPLSVSTQHTLHYSMHCMIGVSNFFVEGFCLGYSLKQCTESSAFAR